ncbi:MAG TPA: hypothetical protein VES20_07730, partial [Bryobacteraceae bacterium]|nr:hypothetical protein [Bryobacteraceae bacterium]
RRGYLLGGTITSTLGVGIAVSLYITRPDSSWTVGVLAVLVGAVLIGTGLAIRRTSDPERQRDIR